jgi:hypothetical protein
VRSLLIRRPGELNESRSFASPPHGRFAFSLTQAMLKISTCKQQILKELRQRCDSRLCVSCVLTLWRHASPLQNVGPAPAPTYPEQDVPGQRHVRDESRPAISIRPTSRVRLIPRSMAQ